jgi:hypothetical protein
VTWLAYVQEARHNTVMVELPRDDRGKTVGFHRVFPARV